MSGPTAVVFLLLLFRPIYGFDVLMVVGGYYHENGADRYLRWLYCLN